MEWFFDAMSDGLVVVDGARMSVPIASSCYREIDEPLNPPTMSQKTIIKSLTCQAGMFFCLFFPVVTALLVIFRPGVGRWKGGFYALFTLGNVKKKPIFLPLVGLGS